MPSGPPRAHAYRCCFVHRAPIAWSDVRTRWHRSSGHGSSPVPAARSSSSGEMPDRARRGWRPSSAELVHADGAAVLLGSCDDDLAVAYQPWVQVVDELFAIPADSRNEQRAGEAARTAGSVARQRGALGARPPLAAARSGVGALPAVRGVCRGSSRGRGAVADGRRARGSALGRRADPCAASPPRQVRAAAGVARRRHVSRHERRAHRATRRLSRRPSAGRCRRHAVALADLDEDAIECFVSEAIGHSLDAGFKDLAAQLGTRSGGNAFYLVELWRDLVASGAVTLVGRPMDHRGSGDSVDRARQRSRSRRRPPRQAVTGGADDDRDGRRRWAADRPRQSSHRRSTCRPTSSTLHSASSSPRVCSVRWRSPVWCSSSSMRSCATPSRRRWPRSGVDAPTSRSPKRSRRSMPPIAGRFSPTWPATSPPPCPLAPVDKAVDYGRQAAAQAVRSAAYDEAASHLEVVLALGGSDLQRARGAGRAGDRAAARWAERPEP